MGRAAAQVPVLMVRVTVVAVLILVFQRHQSNQGNQGGYHQQSGQGNQQQQSGYQSNPKQLNSGQYHVFTTSLCKRDQKLHKRDVNAVKPTAPRYL